MDAPPNPALAVRPETDQPVRANSAHAAGYTSLQTKAIVGAIGLVVLSTGLCGLIAAYLANASLSQTLNRDAQLLAQTLAQSVSPLPGDAAAGRLTDSLNRLTLDPRIAFVTISDPAGAVQSRRITDPGAWHLYFQSVDSPDQHAAADLNRTLSLSYRGGVELLVCAVPIWGYGYSNQPDRVEGQLVLGMSDPAAQRLISQFRAAVIGVVGIISLGCLLPVIAAARSWTRPLRRMLLQARHLTEGRTPEPIVVRQRDEIGQLALAFNEMSARLWATRTQLIAANHDLEEQIDQRTEQLRQANEQLRLQMRDKDEFIRAVTHDLNAPVRNIAGMTRMLLMKYRHELTEDALGKLERIAANARTESELLADLLELSRLRTQPGKRQSIDLVELVQSIAEGLSYDTESHGIELLICSDLPTICADRNRIRQIYQNLLDNAIKYMPAEAPRRQVHVGVTRELDRCVLFVRDTGRGIAPKDHERIFQVFQRARYSGDHDAPGRGVGLASVKTIIETYGGRIWIDSDIGKGTTFYFTFGPEVMARSDPAELNPSPDQVDIANSSPTAI